MKIDELDSQAREAVKAGRDDLARQALERKSALSTQIEVLDRQIADLEHEQEKLEATDRRLTAKVESFRVKKETIKAQYSAAEAQVKVTESLTGISEEMADVGLAVQRSEDKIETMRARSAALDELVERGTLEEFAGGDKVERELAQLKAKSSVEDDLARLKAEEGR